MKRLEEIVKLLEKGDTSLDESLKLFEEGTRLMRICNDMLNQAEQKVTKLISENGVLTEKEFSEDENS